MNYRILWCSLLVTMAGGARASEIDFVDGLRDDASPGRRKRSSDEAVVLQERFAGRVVIAGTSVELGCSATGASSIVWSRDGRPLPPHLRPSRDPRPSLLRSSLNVSHFGAEEAALYSCVALSSGNTTEARHSARIDVYGSPYIRPIGVVKAIAGTDVIVHCPYYGYPISKVEWERGGRTIGIGRRKRSLASNDEGALVIKHAESDKDGGVYTCSVSNPSGEMAKRSFELVVIEPPELEDFYFGSNLQEGQIAQVICSIRSGDTPIQFSWLKDGLPVSSSLKAEERTSELFSVLLIKKVRLEHCGTYTCVASNHAARVNKSAELFVKVAPKWTSEPQNASAVVGRSWMVVCGASGYPQPQVHWMKKDVEPPGSWRPVLDLRGNGLLALPNGSLLLETVSPSHEGLYSCTVDNGVSQPLTKSIWISVNRPAAFLVDTKSVTARKGYPITLTCDASGDHPIRIAWKLDGRPFDFMSKRVKMSSRQTSGGGAIGELAIASVNAEDAGLYRCEASNPHGSSYQNIHLIVKEPPGMPIEVSLDLVRSRTVRMGWRSSLQVQQPLGFTVQYVVHDHRLDWEKAIQLNFTNVIGQARQSGEIVGLNPATAYAVRVSSVGELDSSPFSDPMLFSTLEEAPDAPPTEVTVEATSNPGELKVVWHPPPQHTHNGLVLGYIVKAVPQIKDQSDDHMKTVKVSATKDPNQIPQFIILSGLLKSTRYSIIVSCFNSAGQSPSSPILYHLTREGVPEAAPTDLDCSPDSSTRFRVTWRWLPQHLTGGAMLGYILFYTTPEGHQQNLTTSHTETFVRGLSKFTNYSLEVAAYCSQGLGPVSQTIFCLTKQDKPSSPANVKALPLTSDAIVVSWTAPTQPNGVISHYTVYVKPVGSEEAAQSYRVPSNEDSRTRKQPLRQLDEGRSYEAWVTATTAAGEGESSRKVTAEPTDRVIAGVTSLGGKVSTGAGRSLSLECHAVGNPQPRTVWYHNGHIITHHPRFTLDKDDDTLLVQAIDPSLEGNYTCLAKNLYGSDRVEYDVEVIPRPPSPTLRLQLTADSMLIEWSVPTQTDRSAKIIGYAVSWREAEGKWTKDETLVAVKGGGRNSKVVKGLRCATEYEARVVAKSAAGDSSPAFARVRTLGQVLTAPSDSRWIWSNTTALLLHTDSWGRSDCGTAKWSIDYRMVPTKLWLRAVTLQEIGSGRGQELVVTGLEPANWYQLRVTATNAAGAAAAVYAVSTKTLTGEELGPYREPFDISFMVMVCSSVLVVLSIFVCIIIAGVQKHRHKLLMCGSSARTGYNKEGTRTPLGYPPGPELPPPCPRLYSSPVATRKPSKASTEMFEISPYAQFTMGFQTFGHAENQDRPSYMMKKNNSSYNTDTSFQGCSDTDDESDSLSKSATIVKGPTNKMCRVQYHR